MYRRVAPYVVSIAAVAIALLLTLWLSPVLSRPTAAFFYLAVIASSWYGGWQPGIVTVLLSAGVINYWLLPPLQQFKMSHPNDVLWLAIFVVVASMINLLSTNLRFSKHQVERLSQQLHTENANQLKMALAAARMGMWDWNIVTGEITWSPEHEQLFGFAPNTFDGKYESFEARIHPDDRGGITQAIQHALQASLTYQHEYRIIWPDGSLHWVEGIGHGVYDATGKPIRMTGTIMDVTDRKQAELALHQAKAELEQRVQDRTVELTQLNDRLLQTLQALQASQARFAGILDIANDAIISIEANQQITLFNQGAERVFGYTATEVLGQPLSILLPERFTTSHYHQIQRFALSEGKARRMGERGEIVGRRKDGSEFPAEASISKLQLGDDYIVTAILRDISDRKQAEASMSQLAAIVEFSEDAIISETLDGIVISWNASAERLFGYAATEIVGQSIRAIIPVDRWEEKRQMLQQLQRGERVHHHETVRQHRNGTFIDVALTISPVKDAFGKIIGASKIIRDITAQRALERMKSEFISIVSHELRTPLTAIRGSLGLLAAGVYDNKPDKVKRMLQVASEQTDRLVRLVNDILDLQRLESGSMSLTMQACDVTTLMQAAIDTMQGSAENQQIQLVLVPPVSPLSVWASADAVIQMLTNLLSNAIKFSERGCTVWLSARIWQSGDGEDRGDKQLASLFLPLSPPISAVPSVLFAIKDQGRGIPTDKLATIFERFQQVDASDSREKGGTGLGLAICYKIIEQHGGQIWVESNFGEGSTFYFTLPSVLNPQVWTEESTNS
ncbi:PAS domain S-box protein [Pantanalinema rosaneae CENA516]|uniref:PAS domain S-box protein n=1 Tax=Pantanalinema rosaneae TaxID=1620701 RepID=UPI003D6DDC49